MLACACFNVISFKILVIKRVTPLLDEIILFTDILGTHSRLIKKFGNVVNFACIQMASDAFTATVIGPVLQFYCIFITTFRSTCGI